MVFYGDIVSQLTVIIVCRIIEHARKLGWDDEFELSSHALDAIKQSDVIRKACSRNVTAKGL
jgi:hypothetical protein